MVLRGLLACTADVPRDFLDRIRGYIENSLEGTRWETPEHSTILPSDAFNERRGQYNSTRVLTFLRRSLPQGYSFYLLVTGADLFSGDLNFVFGEAELGGRCAVVSIHRLRHELYGKPADKELLLERTRKEALHELGHVLGLRHCEDPTCVMHFSNSLWDTDFKQDSPCESCRSLLRAGLEFKRRFLRT